MQHFRGPKRILFCIYSCCNSAVLQTKRVNFIYSWHLHPSQKQLIKMGNVLCRRGWGSVDQPDLMDKMSHSSFFSRGGDDDLCDYHACTACTRTIYDCHPPPLPSPPPPPPENEGGKKGKGKGKGQNNNNQVSLLIVKKDENESA